MELENCKIEVKRERTRVHEREEIIVAQQKEFQKRRDSKKKANDEIVTGKRYKEVVEEKKGTESAAFEVITLTLFTNSSRTINIFAPLTFDAFDGGAIIATQPH